MNNPITNTTFLKAVVSEIIKAQDIFTYSHLTRVSNLSYRVAKLLQDEYQFTDRHVELISLYAGFHDLGKIGIPCIILNKPGAFTVEERIIIERHPIIGFQIIESIEERFNHHFIENSQLLKNIIIQHHEFLNGAGYPFHLKDDQIKIEARIVTVCDIYDAMTSYRTYKKTYTREETIREMETMAAEGKIDRICFEALKQITE